MLPSETLNILAIEYIMTYYNVSLCAVSPHGIYSELKSFSISMFRGREEEKASAHENQMIF